MKPRKCKIYYFLLCFVCLTIYPVQAQEDSWQQVNGPYGGFISHLVTGKNGCICASTDYGGLYVSNDNGNHWTERISRLILCLAVNTDGKLFAGGLDGLFTSTDDGITWKFIKPPEFHDQAISAIAIDSSNHVYLGLINGLFRSDDNGESWIELNSRCGIIRCLTTGPRGVVFAGCDNGIYRTTDFGNNWSEMNQGLESLDMRSIVITKSGFVLASTYGMGVFRSRVYGDSWVKVLNDFSFCLAIDNVGHIFHGAVGSCMDCVGPGIYRSDDDGLTWMSVNTGLGNLEVRSLVANAGDSIFAGTNGMGVFLSSNLGLSWEETNEGLNNMTISCLTGNSKNEIFAGCLGAGIQKSSDGGVTWERITGDLDPWIHTIAIDSSDRIFFSNRGGAFLSTDDGENWESLSIGIDGPMFAFLKDGSVVATGPGGAWISDSKGVNWAPSLSINNPEHLTDVVVNDSNYIITGAFHGLYISEDCGVEWSHIIIDSIYHYVYRLLLNINGSLFASAFHWDAPDYGCKVFRSDDNGTTWTAANNGLTTDYQVWSFINDSSGCIYLGTIGAGVYRSSDNGRTWIPFNNGLIRKDIGSLYIDRTGYLYAGSLGGGNLKKGAGEGFSMNPDLKSDLFNESNLSGATTGGYLFRIKIVGGSTNYISFPESRKVTLEQNFPNPFSVNSTIRYHLVVPEIISLKVYNSLGQLVAILVNERKDAGTHEVLLDGNELPAGVYFYRLQTKKTIVDKKFLISR